MAVSQRVKASQLEEVNLGTTEEARPVHIAKEMTPENKTAMITLLKEFRDVFAWSYEDMRGLDPQLYQHQIHLSKDTKPVVQRRYRMNPNYATKVKEEIDKLLRVGFIRPVKKATWLSPIVVVPKKNGKIRVCGTNQHRNLGGGSGGRTGRAPPTTADDEHRTTSREAFRARKGWNASTSR